MVQFDRDLDKLAHFLAQTWHYMERYGGMDSDDAPRVHAMMSTLEGGTAGWLVSLHNARVSELGNLDVFMQIL